jgi:ATP-binding cassette subfamily G (WHITE) protein 1
MAISPTFFVPLLIMAGLYVNPNSIPFYFRPFEYISPFKYAFAALAQNEFEGLSFICG